MMRSRNRLVCAPAEPAVKINSASFSWPNGDPALQDVSLEVKRGEFVWVNGESGSGKSTLHKMAAGMVKPLPGTRENPSTVKILGQDVNQLSRGKKSKLFKRVGLGFQQPAIIPGWSVGENMTHYSDITGQSDEHTRPRAREILGRLGLENHAEMSASRLSGGQAQLLELGALMLTRPDVLLLDEPTAAMDTATKEATLGWLRETSKEEGTSILMVSHDLQSAEFVDRSVTLEDGRIVPATVEVPQNRYHGILPPQR